MPTKTRGRPVGSTELTPEIQGKICAALSLGVFLEAAAWAAGVTTVTLWRWRKLGEEGPGIYRDFCNALEEARGRKVIRNLNKISQDPDWRSSAWILERTEPAHYGQQIKIEGIEPPGKPSYRPAKKPKTTTQ